MLLASFVDVVVVVAVVIACVCVCFLRFVCWCFSVLSFLNLLSIFD